MGNCQNMSSGNEPVKADKIQKNNATNLIVKAYSWNRDSHGLFDYESKSIVKNMFKVPGPGVIVREKDEVRIIVASQYEGEIGEVKQLAAVDTRELHYFVDSDISSIFAQSDQKSKPSSDGIGDSCVWTVVKSLKTPKGEKGYQLQVGDYLKLGRVRFRIKELQPLEADVIQARRLTHLLWRGEQPINLLTNLQNNDRLTAAAGGNRNNKGNFYFGSNVQIMNLDDSDVVNEENEEVKKRPGDSTEADPNEQVTCRICLGDNDESDNPFITPCKCDGTMKSIHVKCLQQWLKSRLHPKETPYSISFVWKTFDCELCKHQFPNMVKVKGIVYDTVEIPRPVSPYVTLEILSKDKNICKGIHVITLGQKKQIRLGRGHDSEIRVSDISVSRCHAVISYDAGIFTIEDNNSKFGTLVFAKDPIKLTNENNNIAVQVGRTVLSFILKKNWKIYQAIVPPQPMKSSGTVTVSKVSNSDFKGQVSCEQQTMIGGPSGPTTGNNQKLKLISAPTNAVDIEDVIIPNESQQDAYNNSAFPRGSLQPPSQMSQCAGDIIAPQPNGGGASFQLSEFKDPAEELEVFQREQEKEKEMENLQRQLVLLMQHRTINQQNLEDEAKSQEEKLMLISRIEKYTLKIQEIQASFAQLGYDSPPLPASQQLQQQPKSSMKNLREANFNNKLNEISLSNLPLQQ